MIRAAGRHYSERLACRNFAQRYFGAVIVAVLASNPAVAQSQSAGQNRPLDVGSTSSTGAVMTNQLREKSTPNDSTRRETMMLRIEPATDGDKIYRGLEAEPIASIGGWRGVDLEKIVTPSLQALKEAHTYNQNYFRGNVLIFSGIGFFGAALAAHQLGNGGGTLPLAVGGFVALKFGFNRVNLAYRAASKAVWWYNHDLVP